MGRLSERYDVFGQDTYTPLEEEHFASEMGQPSIVPREHHEPLNPSTAWDDFADETVAGNEAEYWRNRAAVLCQTPVTCSGCGRQTKPFEDVLVMVDGEFWHDECAARSGPE